MRVLTVRHPWAWAIIHGGKAVENRSRNIAGSYRGPVAIHVSQATSPEAFYDPEIMRAYAEATGNAAQALVDGSQLGSVIGVVDLASVHHDTDHGRGYPCSRWAMPDHWHLVLANPRSLATPIPARGRLGLWHPDDNLAAAIREQVPA